LGTGIRRSVGESCNWCNGSLNPGGVLPSTKWWCNGSRSPAARLLEMLWTCKEDQGPAGYLQNQRVL
jgi:hypothetical protein